MPEKPPNTPTSRVDPDDAPELTSEFFDRGRWFINGSEVSCAEGQAAMRAGTRCAPPKASKTKQALTVSYDPEAIAALKNHRPRLANTHERGA